MILKQLIKECIPPIISNQILRNFRKSSKSQKIYPTYEEALKDSTCDLAHQDDDLVTVVFENTKKLRTILDNEPYLHLDFPNTNSSLALSFAINQNKINVIDLGGGCGAHYFIFKKVIGNQILINWKVVETTAMCHIGKQIENAELKFYDNLSDAFESMKNIDLFFASGSIQYFKEPAEILEDIINLNARYLFLTKLSLSKEESNIISLQESLLSQNWIGELPLGINDRIVKIPHTNMLEKNLLHIVNKKYNIKLKFEDQTGRHAVNDKNIIGYGLLLEKTYP